MLRERVRDRRGERDLLFAPQSRKREEKEQRAHDVVKELAGGEGVVAALRHHSKVGGGRSSSCSGRSCSLLLFVSTDAVEPLRVPNEDFLG